MRQIPRLSVITVSIALLMTLSSSLSSAASKYDSMDNLLTR